MSYEAFKQEWLEDVIADQPNSVDKGRRFAWKLVKQWLDWSEDDDLGEIHYCDGANDGGIDLAVLVRADKEEGRDGDTWYLVQSKYGTAFAGADTIRSESKKMIKTVEGKQATLSSLSQDIVERLQTFQKQLGSHDRLVLLLATVDPLTEDERDQLDDVRSIGQVRLGAHFTTDAISLETIHERLAEQTATAPAVTLLADLVECGPNLRVGSVRILELYRFLKDYQTVTGDLDRIYDKNVRKFRGLRVTVNAGIRDTLEKEPGQFGLFNNGVTIVASAVVPDGPRSYRVTTPYVVNGCQTTRTLHDTLARRLEAGGQGKNPALEEWKSAVGAGYVILKLVQVAADQGDLLSRITRFTNRQNAVRERDFIALEDDFQRWAKEMADQHGIFLEIQRGAWDSRRAYQRQHPEIKPAFAESVNAFDLLKVFGAGWLGKAGVAFGKNAPFLPNGELFHQIVTAPKPFGVRDLYAARCLQALAEPFGFGRGAAQQSRRQSRFLFYKVAIELLGKLLVDAGLTSDRAAITTAVLKLCGGAHCEAQDAWSQAAVKCIDQYLTQNTARNAWQEPLFQDYNGDLNSFLKSEKLGAAEETPNYSKLLDSIHLAMGLSGVNGPDAVIKSALLA